MPALGLAATALQERPQYLYHFVLHAALDAVEEQEWHTNSMHLGVVDRFNQLQVGWARPPALLVGGRFVGVAARAARPSWA